LYHICPEHVDDVLPAHHDVLSTHHDVLPAHNDVLSPYQPLYYLLSPDHQQTVYDELPTDEPANDVLPAHQQ